MWQSLTVSTFEVICLFERKDFVGMFVKILNPVEILRGVMFVLEIKKVSVRNVFLGMHVLQGFTDCML